MPHSLQAKKRLRQGAARRVANRALASRMKTEIKRVLATVEGGNADEARKLLPEAMKRIDKAARHNVIHPNNAARKKAHLARRIQALEKGAGK